MELSKNSSLGAFKFWKSHPIYLQFIYLTCYYIKKTGSSLEDVDVMNKLFRFDDCKNGSNSIVLSIIVTQNNT